MFRGLSAKDVMSRGAGAAILRGGGRATHHGRIGAIDGLRALAILGVVAYHTRPSLLDGGFIGVTIFFVISGFLTTVSVERRLNSERGLDYWSYLWRKVKRLVIPVLAMIALLAPILYIFSPGLLPKFRADSLSAAFFVTNITYIVRQVSYFAASGLPSPLTHLWFVALIMQFYILWPMVLWAMNWLRCTKAVKLLSTALLAAGSTAVMVWHGVAAQGDAHAYYGLDSRAAELLIGALLALVMEDRGRRSARAEEGGAFVATSKLARIALGVAGWCLVLALMVMYVTVNGEDSALYQGGYQIVALVVVFLLVVVLEPTNLCSRVLASAPLQYLGSRAFSIYLVHYPLLELMNPATRMSRPSAWQWGVQMLVIWGAAELFYRGVEVARQAKRRHAGVLGEISLPAKVLAVLGLVVVLVCNVAPNGVDGMAAKRSQSLRGTMLSLSDLGAAISGHPVVRRSQVPEPTLGLPPQLVPKAGKVPSNIDAGQWTLDRSTGVCSANPLIISDSVEMGAQSYVQQLLPAAVQDNKVGRGFSAAQPLYEQYANQGRTGSVVIVALGTNGRIANREQVENLISAVHGQPLYFTTVRGPVAWQDDNNELLVSVASRHRNVGVLDWYAVSENHPEYFYDDGIHLTPGADGGRQAFGKMVVRGLCGQ